MRWRMVLEVVGADGGRQVHEVGIGGRPPAGHSAATLGLSLEESVMRPVAETAGCGVQAAKGRSAAAD